jgi:hypothetical protein
MLRLCFKTKAAGSKGLPVFFSFMWHRHSLACVSGLFRDQRRAHLHAATIVDRRHPRLRHDLFPFAIPTARKPSLN